MRKITFFVVLLFLATHGTAAAEAERVIFDNNEYGGVTKEIIYSEDDATFKKGLTSPSRAAISRTSELEM